MSYTTWNPSDCDSHLSLSPDRLTVNKPSESNVWRSVRATVSHSSGKWYYETRITQVSQNNYFIIGVGRSTAALTSYAGGAGSDSWGWQSQGALVFNNANVNNNYGTAVLTSDIVMIALDQDAGKLWIGMNHIWFNSGNPVTGANPSFTGVTGVLFPMVSIYSPSHTLISYFSPSDQIYAPPTGFSTWGTALTYSDQLSSLFGSNLLAYWALDESAGSTLTDIQSAYPLTITGTPSFSQPPLLTLTQGTSIDFAGASASGSFVSLNGLSDFLVGLFIKTATPSQTVLSKSGVFSIAINADGKLVFTVNSYSLTSTSVVTTNVPIQILCIFQFNKMEIVINGVQDAAQNFKASSQFNVNLIINSSANLTNTTLLNVPGSYSLAVNATDKLVLTTSDGVCTSTTSVANTSGVVTSTDGITWTLRTAPNGDWSSVTYGGSLFVAVGSDSNLAMTSPDGITWTLRTLPAIANWTAVGYGNGKYVAVSSNSQIGAISSDGITWTQTVIKSGTWNTVSYGNGKYFVTGYGDEVGFATNAMTNTNMYSSDGVNWSSVYMLQVAGWQPYTSWTGGFHSTSGYFHALPDGTRNGVNTVYPGLSSDGVTWNSNSTIPTQGLIWTATGFNGPKLTGFAKNTTTGMICTGGSASWTNVTLPVAADWKSASYGNSTYCVVATNSSIALTSSNATTWTQRTLPKVSYWNSLAFGNGIFVAVAGIKDIPVSAISDSYSMNLRLNDVIESTLSINNSITDAGTQPLVLGPVTGVLDEIFISKQLLKSEYLYNLAFDNPYERRFISSDSDYVDLGAPPTDVLNQIYSMNESRNDLDCYDSCDITYSVSATPTPTLFVRAPFVTVEGTVTVETPPTSRKVLLMERSNKRVVRSTWSDPVTGYYSFTDIKVGDYIVWSDVWLTPIPTDFRGPGKIWGVVDDVNLLPLSVRIVLLEHSTYRLVAFTMSDPTTGYYEFNNLSTSTVFTLIAENEDFHYNHILRSKVHAI